MNKQLLLDHFNQVVDTLFMAPGSDSQYWTIAVVGFLMIAWVFVRVGERMDVANVEGFAGFMAAALGTAAMLASMTAASIWVAPFLKLPVNYFFLVIVGYISAVVVVVPVLKFWTQAHYTNTLTSWCLALTAGLAVAYGVTVGFEGALGGAAHMKKGSEHKRELQRAMDGK